MPQWTGKVGLKATTRTLDRAWAAWGRFPWRTTLKGPWGSGWCKQREWAIAHLCVQSRISLFLLQNHPRSLCQWRPPYHSLQPHLADAKDQENWNIKFIVAYWNIFNELQKKITPKTFKFQPNISATVSVPTSIFPTFELRQTELPQTFQLPTLSMRELWTNPFVKDLGSRSPHPQRAFPRYPQNNSALVSSNDTYSQFFLCCLQWLLFVCMA